MSDVSSIKGTTQRKFPAQKGKPPQTGGLSMTEIEEKYTQAVHQDPDYPRFVSFEAFAQRFQPEQTPEEPTKAQLEKLYNEEVKADPDYPRFVSFESFSKRHQAGSASENAPKIISSLDS